MSKQSDSTCHNKQDMRGLWHIIKRTDWSCNSPTHKHWIKLHWANEKYYTNNTAKHQQAWSGGIFMLLRCVACHTEDCYTIFIMGKGPEGGIWYAGEGEQDQNYLTQLVLQTWEENSFKGNYFQANRQWFTSQNTTKNDTDLKNCCKCAETEKACRLKLALVITP